MGARCKILFSISNIKFPFLIFAEGLTILCARSDWVNPKHGTSSDNWFKPWHTFIQWVSSFYNNSDFIQLKQQIWRFCAPRLEAGKSIAYPRPTTQGNRLRPLCKAIERIEQTVGDLLWFTSLRCPRTHSGYKIFHWFRLSMPFLFPYYFRIIPTLEMRPTFGLWVFCFTLCFVDIYHLTTTIWPACTERLWYVKPIIAIRKFCQRGEWTKNRV